MQMFVWLLAARLAELCQLWGFVRFVGPCHWLKPSSLYFSISTLLVFSSCPLDLAATMLLSDFQPFVVWCVSYMSPYFFSGVRFEEFSIFFKCVVYA